MNEWVKIVGWFYFEDTKTRGSLVFVNLYLFDWLRGFLCRFGLSIQFLWLLWFWIHLFGFLIGFFWRFGFMINFLSFFKLMTRLFLWRFANRLRWFWDDFDFRGGIDRILKLFLQIQAILELILITVFLTLVLCLIRTTFHDHRAIGSCLFLRLLWFVTLDSRSHLQNFAIIWYSHSIYKINDVFDQDFFLFLWVKQKVVSVLHFYTNPVPVAVRKHLLQHVFFRGKVQNVTLWKSPLFVLVTVLYSRVNPCRFETEVLQCFLDYVNVIITAHDMLGFCRVPVRFGLSLQNRADLVESFRRKCRKPNQVVDCMNCAVIRKPSLLFKVNLLAWNTHLPIKKLNLSKLCLI